MSINLLGDGVRDALDPRLRSGALERPLTKTRVERQYQPLDPDPALLATQNLHTEFQIGHRVYKSVNDVSISVDAGECLGIIGESGSGKSVTALSVAALVASPPGVITGGAVWYRGDDLLDASPNALRKVRGNRIAYVFQDPLSTLHPLFRVGEQIAECLTAHTRLGREEVQQRVIDLLNAVRVPSAESRVNNYPHELSGGLRQRIGIAMALANSPDIIIADEPTTALDVTVQAEILALLDELRRERGLAIIFITHDFGVVSQLCDRVAVMYAGRIVETGPTREVLSTPAHPYTRQLINCLPVLGEGRRLLDAIPGLPPALDELPDGCAFSARCAKVEASCRTGDMPLYGPATRQVRCLFPETPLKPKPS